MSSFTTSSTESVEASQTPAPTFSAASSCFRAMAMVSATAFACSFLRAIIVSKAISSRCSLNFSGRPKRTALMPARCKPSAMLSTATLLSEVASTGESPKVLIHICRTLTETWVFPVPGGPCTILQRLTTESTTARRCDSLRSEAPLTTSHIVSRRAPAALWDPSAIGSSCAKVTMRFRSCPLLSCSAPGLATEGTAAPPWPSAVWSGGKRSGSGPKWYFTQIATYSTCGLSPYLSKSLSTSATLLGLCSL
mmetsp:Transcript_39099/g.125713  ORF Transcript_39099/g.125713 Transcript_39099/m.125713 type:complete len:251 (+) Transcript_39099:2534-3286(+)